MDVHGKKIYVGLSGGVDSAVSAALLKQAGALVGGVFIKGWYPPGMPCTWAADRRDAMRVAARLHIPFFTLDARAEYKRSVIDYLLAEYRAGRTPNPDVMCNKEVKFGAFYRYAKEQGADAIATGHYESGEKDQRYFLWAVPKEILEATIFPVGHKEKREVRALAKRFQLPVAQKRDSQGVCFLGSISVEEFLRSEFGENPGRAIDEQGMLVGEHDGVLLHTLGERIALQAAHEPGQPTGTVPAGPWFVLAKDIAKNELTVGKSRVPIAPSAAAGIRFTNANWFTDPSRATNAQYRYRGPRIPGFLEKAHDTDLLQESQVFRYAGLLPEVPAPGQSVVFYRDDELVGGGIITV